MRRLWGTSVVVLTMLTLTVGCVDEGSDSSSAAITEPPAQPMEETVIEADPGSVQGLPAGYDIVGASPVGGSGDDARTALRRVAAVGRTDADPRLIEYTLYQFDDEATARAAAVTSRSRSVPEQRSTVCAIRPEELRLSLVGTRPSSRALCHQWPVSRAAEPHHRTPTTPAHGTAVRSASARVPSEPERKRPSQGSKRRRPLTSAIPRPATHRQGRDGLTQLPPTAPGQQAGFVTDLSARAHDVPFRPALERIAAFRTAALLAPALQSNTVEIVQADEVSLDELFALDTELRQDVPGNDGWRGNRVWFDDEMTSPEYDPTAYVVGRDRRSGDLVGLCRIWNNGDGPALGILGVRRSHRTGWPALRLLHASMLAASRWGSPSFSTNTARPSLQRGLRTIGAVETGGFLRLIQAERPAGYGC